MNITKGQGMLLKIPFADGGSCNSARTFLVIDTDPVKQTVSLLNVSSIKGKSHKVLFGSNKKLYKYNPPFNMPSFVKLDALYEIKYFPELDKKVLRNGITYDEAELKSVLEKLEAYRMAKTASFTQVLYDQTIVNTA